MNPDAFRFPDRAPDPADLAGAGEHPMAACFRSLELKFTIDDEGDLVSGMATEHGPCPFFLRYEPEHRSLWVRACLPIHVPEEHGGAVLALCNLINVRANNTCLCLDPAERAVILRISSLVPDRTPWPERFGARFVFNLVGAIGTATRAVAPVAAGKVSPESAFADLLNWLSSDAN